MSVPEYQEWMLPMLNAVSDGREHTVAEITEKVVSSLGLTDDERKQLLPGGGQTVIANRAAWAKTQLKRAGLLTTPTKGTVSITDEGKAVLARRPGRIDNDFLRQFPAYQEWAKGHKDDRPDQGGGPGRLGESDVPPGSGGVMDSVIRLFSNLANLLPRLKTPIQLIGFVVLVSAFIVIRSIDPNNVPALIAGGAIGVLFLVFGQLFYYLNRFPGPSRVLLVLLALVIFAALVVTLLIVTARSLSPLQTVSVRLLYQGRTLPRDFDLIAYVPGMDPVGAPGRDGVASIHVLAKVSAIDDLSVKCTGYSVKDRGPFGIEGGVVSVVMVDDGPPNPIEPEKYPSDAWVDQVVSVDGAPSVEEVKASPRVSPGDVSFRYKNLTNSPLRLLLYSWSRRYPEPLPESVLAPNSPWAHDLPFPAINDFQTFEPFKGGTGWYSFFVYDAGRRPGSERVSHIGTRNIYRRKDPSLTVTAAENSDKPFRADFNVEK
jgi:hypothetical protein